MKRIFSLLLLLMFFQTIIAQVESKNQWAEQLSSFKIKPIIGFQLWSTYSTGMEVYNDETGAYDPVDDRFNTQIRRIRLGVQGQPYRNIKFHVNTALDFVGRDVLAAPEGGANNGGSPAFRVWNAYIQWKLDDNADGFHLTVGYMAPHLGRESITGALRVSSLEKSWSQNYLRRQLVGTGPGRAVGLNLGGLFFNEKNNFGFSYDLGLFNPVSTAYSGNSTGSKYTPLISGRAVFHFGDPEFKKYTLSHKVNYFGKRKGLSIAVAGAYQGETDLFKENKVFGFDWLFNWDQLNINGEWHFLERKGVNISKVNSNTGFLCISYNLVLKQNRYFEPTIMIMQFNGAMDAKTQGEASQLGAFAGQDHTFDIGINYHFNTDIKLGLHYTFKNADAGEAEPGATFNNYLFQGGVGAIHRGDWLGLGFVAIF